ncbi:hypothetical protein [Streptomyces lydicus]|uniref:hypothetical protein n=1 Tax=Streptomyces lydicus TaxID=47763 RepID=UPI00379EF938
MRVKLSAWKAAAASSVITAVAVLVPLSISSAGASAAPEEPIIVEGPLVGAGELSYAKCPEGTRVSGGGMEFADLTLTNSGRNPNFALTRDGPARDGSGWVISSFSQHNKNRAFAMCPHP